jgi:uncharacterized protein (DUF736 family)
MPGQKPDFRFIVKDAETGKWNEIGAAWKKASGNFGVTLDPEGNGGFIKCLMVKGQRPQPKAKVPDEKPAA